MRGTSHLRPLPDVVILGAMKAGSTSFYEYLIQHPRVHGSVRKEVHFLEQHYNQGIQWYRAQFPISWPRNEWTVVESTPYYLSYPDAPTRASLIYPQARFVVLLRDPVDRAISQWKDRTRSGREHRSLEQILDYEGRLSDAQIESIAETDWRRHHHLILAHGYYEAQLRRWFTRFDRSQFLILESSDFFSTPQETMAEAFDFISIRPFHISDLTPMNVGDNRTAGSSIKSDLAIHYARRNEGLCELLGREFRWPRR